MNGDTAKQEGISITPFRGLAGLESLREAWGEVVSGMGHRRFFHLWEWYWGYLTCLEPEPDRLTFFLLSQGTMPVAIFPLQFTRVSSGGMRLKAWAFPAHRHLSLCDILCRDEAVHLPLFPALIGFLGNQGGRPWDVIQLSHLLEDACALRALRQQMPPRVLTQREGRCDFLDATGEYEPFLAGLSKNFRRSLKRAGQYLEPLPGVQFTMTKEGPALEAQLAAFMDVEASGWKGSQGIGTAIKLHPSLRNFYQTLARTLSPSGGVSINTLTVDGKCIAAQFCLLVDDTAYILKIGYDENFKRYAPGNLLLGFFLRRSMEDGVLKRINLVTDVSWHEDWKPRAYEKSSLCIFNETAAGIIGHAAMKSYPVLQKLYQAHIKPRLPRRLQEWIGGRLHGKAF